MKAQDPVLSSETNEWYTPRIYIEAARRAMGSIDLDPASSAQAQKTVKAGDYWTIEKDGLSRMWFGNVWLNPPYGKTRNKSNTGRWAQHLFNEYTYQRIDQAILLCGTHHTTQKSIQKLMNLDDSWVCFPESRIKFIDAWGNEQASPTRSNLFIYVGANWWAFCDEFNEFGVVI